MKIFTVAALRCSPRPRCLTRLRGACAILGALGAAACADDAAADAPDGGAGGGSVATSTGGAGAAPSGGGGPDGGAGGQPTVPSETCDHEVPFGLPEGAPALEVGVWTDITPDELVPFLGSNVTMIAQGLAIDPCNPATLYWGTTPFETDKGGLFKSTDGGGSWSKIGQVVPNFTGVDHFDSPVHVRVDPKDPQHLYVGDGVRGGTMGFWVSHDGGENFAMPASYDALNTDIFIFDVYDVRPDPTDFQHVLVSFHSAWKYDSPEYGQASGVLESKDGGETWIVHPPDPGLTWGTGHAINFLYNPELGIGDADTWLLGTQSDGTWRTEDAGEHWTKVNEYGIVHGGGTIYYASDGTLYASAYPRSLRSEDNGLTWTPVGPDSTTCVYGDGELLYTATAISDASTYFTSPETDGTTWTAFQRGAQTWKNGGPFEMALDPVNRILYSSNWEQGVMALKLP